jgi:cell wall-associated NlpC family hydrolase
MSRHRLLHRLLAPGAAIALTPVALIVGVATGVSQLPAPATPSAFAVTDIPTTLLTLYQRSATGCPGLSWTVLAGIGKVESNHNRPPHQVSPAGAQGPMQFLPSTWATYAIDGNHDGTADPFDPADTIPTAAIYLCALGATHETRTAVAAYSCGGALTCRGHALGPDGYVSRVLGWAARYTDPGSADSPVATIAVQTALAQFGTPYLWGGENPTTGFDCSGLVQYAYRRAGLTLPRTAQTQYDAGLQLTSDAAPEPGDLVFFGPDPSHVTHVGISLGDGRMVDAPHTGANVREEPIAGVGHYLGATRPAYRAIS